MKTILITLVLSVSLFAMNYKDFAKQMNYETDYKVAVEKAKKENKELMLFMVANFCPWCIKFEKKVLKKEAINTQIHKKYVPLILNREEGKFPEQFKTEMIPTAYFVDAKSEKVSQKIVGYHNRATFIDIVEK